MQRQNSVHTVRETAYRLKSCFGYHKELGTRLLSFQGWAGPALGNYTQMTRPLDIMIVTVPHDELEHPRSAPAVLKGIVEQQGHSCGTLNTATVLYDQLDRSVERFMQTQEYFVNYQLQPPQELEAWYSEVIQRLRQRPARFIGISVFTGWSHVATVELCRRIRQHMPGQRIVLGGRGLDVRPFGNTRAKCGFTETQMRQEFHHAMIGLGLADSAILGDAERAITELLVDKDPMTRMRMPIDPVLRYPAPDFSDTDLSLYIGADKHRPHSRVQLPVVSSKGCVRACDFCDVAAFNPKYMYKPGRDLFAEMKQLAQRHGVRDFAFVDSIANGNLRQLREAVRLLKEHNLADPEQRITWSGNWIARPISQQGDSQFYDDLKASGLESVTIGAEHWSNRVLESMDKKSTAEAFWRELDEFQRVGIPVIINTITGHWSETFDDFVIWLKAITRLQRYIARGSVYGISAGSGFHLLEKTPAARNPDLVTFDRNWDLLFYAKSNPNMGFTERMYRTLISNIHMTKLNSNITRTVYKKILDYMENDWENIVKLQKIIPYTQSQTPEKRFYDNIDEFSQSLISEEFNDFTAELDLHAGEGGLGLPHVEILFNDEMLFDQTLSEGHNRLRFGCKYDHRLGNKLEIRLKNKDKKRDTVIDTEGNIIKDKYVKILGMKIDGVQLIEKYQFWQNNIEVKQQDAIVDSYQPGLWQNGHVVVKFKQPIPIEVTHNPTFYYLNEGHDLEKNFENIRAIENKLIILDGLGKKQVTQQDHR